ncbi:MAG: hypothetical protein NTW32_23755 [Chloroflexi bacterium]|nr:hypothetical protein [Chloroflexota bacterium]
MSKQRSTDFLLFFAAALASVAGFIPSAFEVPHLGYRNIFWLLALLGILTVSYSWIWKNKVRPLLQNRTRQELAAHVGFSIAFGILLIIMVPIKLDHYYSFLLPSHTLEILPVSKQNDTISLISFDTDWGGLPAGKIDLPYKWQGKPGPLSILNFQPETNSHLVRVVWDGNEHIVDLSRGLKKGWLFDRQYFDVPHYHSFIYSIFLGIALFFTIFWFTCVIIGMKALPGSRRQIKLFWLALPMLSVWMVYLLTFWPGLSSYDTMQQWREAQAGVFTDAHPALHTMFIAAVSRIFPSLAAIALIQILALAFVTAWGLVELNKQGLPTWATWGLAGSFALLPVNSLLVITVWKDILYGCALFAFFIQFIKIVLSKGDWLNNKNNLAGYILAGLATVFLRHNGFPVIIASIFILALPYQKLWKINLFAIIFISGVYFFVRGPFYDYMKVKKYPAMINILMLDHIGAHIKAGTAIDKDDLAYLDQLIPIQKWPYACANSEIRNMDGPIPFDFFSINDPRPAQIALKLFFKNPMVDIKHTLCAAEIFWKVNPDSSIYTIPMQGRQYVMPNEFGITSHTLLPALVFALPVPQPDTPLIWRPAFYLLILIYCQCIVVLKGGTRNLFLISIPIIIQTGVMFLVNYANDFRYMFSTELSALLIIGLVFLPLPVLQDARSDLHKTNSENQE